MVRARTFVSPVLLAALLALPAAALAHPERQAFYPDGTKGSVPVYRSRGPSQVVCKDNSKTLVKQEFTGRKLRSRLKTLARCKFHDIQAAVDAASSGDRILIMPGVYEEKPSIAQVDNSFDYNANLYDKSGDKSPCKDMYQDISEPLNSALAGRSNTKGTFVPTYEHQFTCPNHQNLIAIIGDDPKDPDRVCDHKCNLQIEGLGKSRADVLISGSRRALNVIRADRADGIYLKHFTVEYSDFNNIYVLETNGFRIDDVTSRYGREYDILSFTSDHGLYEHLETYGAGDSGVYPGSGPEGHCARYGIELRDIDSHDNVLGYSGTAGNGVWVHDSKFHDNGTGMTTDSFASGHPGMPQDCAKWEHNEIYSNNQNFFTPERTAYCKIKNRPVLMRDPKVVCPTFQSPVGTGAGIFGGNGNIVRDNWIYDNWRDGTKLLWVPATFRGDMSPEDAIDTSFENTYASNHMGYKPDGTRAPNGNDFWWDGEGKGNCWTANLGFNGTGVTSNMAGGLPDCPGAGLYSGGDPTKTASQATCSQWNPQDDTLDYPPGCDWFTTPPRPR